MVNFEENLLEGTSIISQKALICVRLDKTASEVILDEHGAPISDEDHEWIRNQEYKNYIW